MVTVVHRAPASAPDEKSTKAVLQKLQDKSLEQRAADLAAKNQLAYIDLRLLSVDFNDVSLIPETEAKELGAGIFRHENGVIFVGLTRVEPSIIEKFEALAKQKNEKLRVYVISEKSFEKILATYTQKPFLEHLDQRRVNLEGADLESFDKDFGELIALSQSGERLATTKAMEIVLAGATKLDSSDVHIEAGEKEARLRFRIDGELEDIGKLPTHLYRLILSRIKLLSKMKLNVRDRAQDGHFEMYLDDKRTDIRVSVIPGQYGENINMRLLHEANAFVDVKSLGMRASVLEEVLAQAEKPNGLILNTGPTGSGKTTTLYGLLNYINKPESKIITVEDPIEYRIPGIVQTEVTEKETVTHQTGGGGSVSGAATGYSFADALRAVVRQDPDVILVGEIRDRETAETAMNASLTGHLVFSTLHTNDAPASITRFRELGISPSLVASAVNIFIAQRLVRKLCQNCKQTYEPAEATKHAFMQIIKNISPAVKEPLPTEVTSLSYPVGCEQCSFTGYKGRIAVYEMFPVTTTMANLLNENPSENDIRALAKKEGMLSLIEDGVLKCLEGITTLTEVVRHTGVEESLHDFFKEILEAKTPEASSPKTS